MAIDPHATAAAEIEISPRSFAGPTVDRQAGPSAVTGNRACRRHAKRTLEHDIARAKTARLDARILIFSRVTSAAAAREPTLKLLKVAERSIDARGRHRTLDERDREIVDADAVATLANVLGDALVWVVRVIR